MKRNISKLDKFKINLDEITTEMKPVNFTEELYDNIAKYTANLIDKKMEDLIKPYVEYESNGLSLMMKDLKERGYKVEIIEKGNYTEYSIEYIETEGKDYFLVKNNTDIKQEKNKYTATNYISDIVRNIKKDKVESKIICPYCGYEHRGLNYIEVGDMEGEFSMNCEGCKEEFKVKFNTIIEFKTEK